MTTKISVLGAGSWGTALAMLAARNGCQTLLWGHNPEHIAQLKEDRENKHYLAGLRFPDTLNVTSELEEVATFSSLLLISVPSHAFKATLLNLKPFITPQTQIAWATKGFCADNGALLDSLVATHLFPQTPTAVLSGPTFAKEVAADLPTAMTIASANTEFANKLSGLLHNQRFRTYTSTDIIGVQVGGAIKNVLAIAAGIADGLGLGANTRAALITRGLSEVIRLGIKLGGKQETFMGLAGLGDLILTCTDDQSRNRRFGLALGQGKSQAEAVKAIGQEIEGVFAAKEAYVLSKKYEVEMPITEQTYKVLYEGLDPRIAVQNLLTREQKAES
ncbi:MAG: NAD(P)H-dependent glycerol-3-phosphate dehydrogenase [Methylococcaceae bacterium]|nr:NAD(P)H-dependent glycerol-3-phosphate dehydrogenase [Methylococcaceae bacterium]